MEMRGLGVLQVSPLVGLCILQCEDRCCRLGALAAAQQLEFEVERPTSTSAGDRVTKLAVRNSHKHAFRKLFPSPTPLVRNLGQV